MSLHGVHPPCRDVQTSLLIENADTSMTSAIQSRIGRDRITCIKTLQTYDLRSTKSNV